MNPDDQDYAVRTLVGEASDQGPTGLAAVAWIFMNRSTWVPRAWWGDTVGAVVRDPEQFSCWGGGANTDRIKAMATDHPEYLGAQTVLLAVLDGTIPDPTGGATTYKVTGTKASWDVAVSDVEPRIIGKHSFWRLSPFGPCLAFLDQPSNAQVASA